MYTRFTFLPIEFFLCGEFEIFSALRFVYEEKNKIGFASGYLVFARISKYGANLNRRFHRSQVMLTDSHKTNKSSKSCKWGRKNWQLKIRVWNIFRFYKNPDVHFEFHAKKIGKKLGFTEGTSIRHKWV